MKILPRPQNYQVLEELKGKKQKKNSTKEVDDVLFIQHFLIPCSILMCLTYLLFLTFPVTEASAESSFSKLKLIKFIYKARLYTRKDSELSILSFESKSTRSIDINEILKTASLIVKGSRKF